MNTQQVYILTKAEDPSTSDFKVQVIGVYDDADVAECKLNEEIAEAKKVVSFYSQVPPEELLIGRAEKDDKYEVTVTDVDETAYVVLAITKHPVETV